MRSYLSITAAALTVLLLAGCSKGEKAAETPPPAPLAEPTSAPAESTPPAALAEPTPGPLASTLEGEALVKYDRLSQEDGLNLEAMARFLGTEIVTEWLLVLAGPTSERFASTLGVEARSKHDDLPRKGKWTFELIALISDELAMDWLSLGYGGYGTPDELAMDWLSAGIRTPAEAFGPSIERPEQPPLAPVIKRDALVPYARLGSSGRADFEFFVKAVGLEAAEESLLRYRERGSGFALSGIFMVPLPPLDKFFSADETAKLEALAPRMRAPFIESWEYGLKIHAPSPSDPTAELAFTDPKAYVAQRTEEETKLYREVLMALPTELPPIEDLVFAEAVAEYEELHPDVKEMFWDQVGVRMFLNQVGMSYASRITVGKGIFPQLTDSEIKEMFSSFVASWTRFQAMSSKYRDKES